MKKLFLFCYVLSSFNNLYSQEVKHTLKLNLFSPFIKTISSQYEYTFSSKKSILCQAGYTFQSKLLEPYYDRYKSFGSRKIIFKDLLFNGGFQITPEFRYYFKDKQNSGFFINPYIRYSRYSFQSHVNYTDDNFNVVFTFKGIYTTANLGINFGYKWLLGNHLILESWLLCIHGGTNRFLLSANDELEFVDKPLFLQDLEKTLKDVPFVQKWASNITDKTIKAGFGYAFFGTRAGLCLGYRFLR